MKHWGNIETRTHKVYMYNFDVPDGKLSGQRYTPTYKWGHSLVPVEGGKCFRNSL